MLESKISESNSIVSVFIRGLKGSLWIGAPVGVWILIGYFELIASTLFSAGSMILAALLFAIALPVSAITRLDLLYLNNPTLDSTRALLVAFMCVAANFGVWNLFLAWRKGKLVLRHRLPSTKTVSSGEVQKMSRLQDKEIEKIREESGSPTKIVH